MMTVTQLSERLNCSVAFAYSLLASGACKHYRLGKTGLRISEEQLQEYLASKEHGGTAKPPVRRPVKLQHLS
jgi:excisionase family DNA binding protein